MAKVFVSYARDDSRKVNRVIGELKAHGFEFWQDTNNIRNGKDWPDEIAKGIMNCARFLLFMSVASMDSDNVKREVQIAYENKKKIIILRLDNSKLPRKLSYQLIGIQRTDYLSSNWESEIVSVLGGGSKSLPKLNTSTNKPPASPLKTHAVKSLSPHRIITELEGVFSANGDYYKDQCDAVLVKLDDLRVIVGNHWVNHTFAYQELIPRVYFLEKIEIIHNLIKDSVDENLTAKAGLAQPNSRF